MWSITAHSIVAVVRRELEARVEHVDFFVKLVLASMFSVAKYMFHVCALRPVVSTGSSPCVELVAGEASNKTGLTGLEVCHLDHKLAV